MFGAALRCMIRVDPSTEMQEETTQAPDYVKKEPEQFVGQSYFADLSSRGRRGRGSVFAPDCQA